LINSKTNIMRKLLMRKRKIWQEVFGSL